MDRRAKKLFDRPKQLALGARCAVFRAELNWTAVCDYREEQIHVRYMQLALSDKRPERFDTRRERERELLLMVNYLFVIKTGECKFLCVRASCFEWHLQLMQLKRLYVVLFVARFMCVQASAGASVMKCRK